MIHILVEYRKCVEWFQRTCERILDCIFMKQNFKLNDFAGVVETRNGTLVLSSSPSQICTLSVSEKNSKNRRNLQKFFGLHEEI